MNNKSIQILRGTRANIDKHKDEELLDGQLIYNLTDNSLAVGGGLNGNLISKDPITVRELKGNVDKFKTDTTEYDYYIRHDGTNLNLHNSKGDVTVDKSPTTSTGIVRKQELDSEATTRSTKDADLQSQITKLDSKYTSFDNSHNNIENSSSKGSIKQIKDSDFTLVNPQATRNNESITSDAIGQFATALGGKSRAEGKRSVSAGTQTIAQGDYSAAFGNNSISEGGNSFVAGLQNVSKGAASFAVGNNNIATGDNSAVFGWQNKVNGVAAMAVGRYNQNNGQAAFTEGVYTKVLTAIPTESTPGTGVGGSGGSSSGTFDFESNLGMASHVEGDSGTAVGYGSHVEGYAGIALAHYSHVEGVRCRVDKLSDSEPYGAFGAHVGGESSRVSGKSSLVHGYLCNASGNYSSIFGMNNSGTGASSLVAGANNKNLHDNAILLGFGLSDNSNKANNPHVIVGRYNLIDHSSYDTYYPFFQVGIGSSDDDRKNALTVTTEGQIIIPQVPKYSFSAIRKRELDQVLSGSTKASQLAISSETYTWTNIVGDRIYGWDNVQRLEQFSLKFPSGRRGTIGLKEDQLLVNENFGDKLSSSLITSTYSSYRTDTIDGKNVIYAKLGSSDAAEVMVIDNTYFKEELLVQLNNYCGLYKEWVVYPSLLPGINPYTGKSDIVQARLIIKFNTLGLYNSFPLFIKQMCFNGIDIANVAGKVYIPASGIHYLNSNIPTTYIFTNNIQISNYGTTSSVILLPKYENSYMIYSKDFLMYQ